MEETALLMRQVRKAHLMDDTEIVEVTRRRRDHEYRLRARGAPRSAFLEYAEFERELAALLRVRSKKQKLKRRRADGIVLQARSRVNLVYSRAVKRFKGDVHLWLHYARHCVDTGTHRTAARVLARAIAMRPDSPDVWLAAIAFHYDTVGDVTGARKLAQRALRTIPEASTLWLNYFRLELSYLCKVIARRVAMRMAVPGGELSDSQPTGTKETSNEQPVSTEVSMQENGASVANKPAPESEDGPDDKNASEDESLEAMETENEHTPMDADSDFVSESESGSASELEPAEQEAALLPLKFWQGGVPIAVFRQARQKAKLQETDIFDYWRVTTEIPFVPAMFINQIVSDIESNTENSLVVRCISARLAFDTAEAKLKHIAPPEALKLKKDTMSVEQDNSAYDAALALVKTVAPSVHASLLEVLRGAEKPTKVETVSVVPILTNFIERAKRYFNEDMVAELTDELVDLQRRQQKAELGVDLTKLTLEGVAANGTFAAWKKFLDDSADASEVEKKKIREVLIESVAVPFRNAEQNRVAVLWVRWEDELKNLSRTMKVLMRYPSASKQVLLAAAESLKLFLEATTSQEKRDKIIVMLRDVFDKLAVIQSCKKDVDFWINYTEFERDVSRDATRSSTVIWKAKKMLSEPNSELFTEKLCIRSLAK